MLEEAKGLDSNSKDFYKRRQEMNERIKKIKTNEAARLIEVDNFFIKYVQKALKNDNLVRIEKITKNQADKVETHLESTKI